MQYCLCYFYGFSAKSPEPYFGVRTSLARYLPDLNQTLTIVLSIIYNMLQNMFFVFVSWHSYNAEHILHGYTLVILVHDRFWIHNRCVRGFDVGDPGGPAGPG